MKKGFTLVEIMIATVISTVIAVFLMRMLTSFTVDATRVGKQGMDAIEVSRILAMLKNYVREAKEVHEGKTAVSMSLYNGDELIIHFDESKSVLIVEKTNKNEKHGYGIGSVLDFEVKKANLKGTNGLYQIVIKYANPRAPGSKDYQERLKTAIEYISLVTKRGIKPLDTVYWIENDKPEPNVAGEG